MITSDKNINLQQFKNLLMQTLHDLRLAVLIDADNIPFSNVKGMLEEIAKYGTPTFKRIYGDWTKPTVAGWKGVLLENAITPVQQYSYTRGKNATDSAMIIDAMDILYSGKVDGFCLVSSDSDFTRLATRLREAGMTVFGIGERKTPSPFIIACDKFIYIEIINSPVTVQEAEPVKRKAGSPARIKQKNESNESQLQIKKVKRLIASSITDLADENGWAYLGDVGNLILKKQPDFDPRNFGFTKLSPLIKSFDFEIDERDSGQNNIKHIYIRNRK
ncbi:MAG: hypothetical protein H6Q23_161 [Bacteroidetes bacterium]|jgi:uncharacterized LabA/DUF88 family protein/Fe-S-cluster formation regulator IscX/YfhJ|nr:hypothetical protein [Bacteroidota bacterium]